MKMRKYQQLGAIMVAALVGVIGVILLAVSHAATGAVSSEVETGTRSGGVLVNDTSASGGAAIKFTATIAKPGPTNTGVPAGQTLTPAVTDATKGITVDSSGNATITKAGIFTNLLIKGRLNIKASNVTIRYSRIEANPSPWDLPAEPTTAADCQAEAAYKGKIWNAITSYNNDANGHVFTNLLIEDTEIVAGHGGNQWLGNGIHGSQYTLRRVDISGTVDGAGMFTTEASANIVVEDSYIHDLYEGMYDLSHNCTASHSDGIQIHNGGGMIIRGNTIAPNAHTFDSRAVDPNSAIQINNANADTKNITIQNNWLDYGACSLNVSDNSKTPTVQYLTVTNNLFGKHQVFNGDGGMKCAMIVVQSAISDGTNSITGNKWEDGSTPNPVVTNGG